MRWITSVLVALCTSVLLSACANTTSNAQNQSVRTGTQNTAATNARIEGVHPQNDALVYHQQGMEMSSITSRMADTLQQNMFYYLLPEAPIDRSSAQGNVKIVTMPRIAVTSFVDTDTYENAGYLGRALAEFFTHEMSSRAFEVTEYKLTGRLSVTTDGDFILSRNWQKIARDTKVKYLLGGTLTRNYDGVVLVARIINMQSRQVIATATDFVPYDLLPDCYRTPKKQCAFEGSRGYLDEKNIREANYYKEKYEDSQKEMKELQKLLGVKKGADAVKFALTRVQVRNSSGQPLGGTFMVPSDPALAIITSGTGQMNPDVKDALSTGDPRYINGVVSGATSRGTYDRFRIERSNGESCSFGKCVDPVVYPASSYIHNTLLVRDSADESNYQRVSNR